jgi:hypothetical protein
MTRDEIHVALSELESTSGLGRREFTRAVSAYLGTPRGFLSVSQAAGLLGISERRVRQLCTAGGLRSEVNPHTRQLWVSPYSVQGRLANGRFKAKEPAHG